MLTKYKQKLKYLLTRKKNKAGRNNTGRITVAHQGGGRKQKYRQIQFNGDISEGFVSNFEYDPNRSAFLAKICNLKERKKKFYYILAPQNLKILDPIDDFKKNFIIKNQDDITATKTIGNCYFLKDLAVGNLVYNIEIHPNTNAKLVRAAGTFGTILKKDDAFITIKLPSNEVRLFSKNCKAFLGSLANDTHSSISWKKAGKSRWLNIRPTVRGVAKNPIDHPHGGNTSGGCHPVTPWAKLTKGKPTRSKKKKNPLIILRSKKNN